MTCQQCRKWWSPYLDSELDAGTTFEVSEHLRTCATCRERFEREACFEDLLRDRLDADAMPDALWADICRDVRREPRLLRMPVRRMWLAAASIGVILFASVQIYDQVKPRPTPTVVEIPYASATTLSNILQQRSPTLVPFADEADTGFNAHLAAVSRDVLGKVVSIDPALSGGHSIELIGATKQQDPNGHPYVEVRLNCCNRPAVITMVADRGATCVAELRSVVDSTTKPSNAGCPKAPPIVIQSIERNGVMIGAATADHYLTGIFASIVVEKSGG